MNTVGSHPALRSAVGRLLLAALPVAAAAGLGAWATLPNIPTWYEGLAKPPLTPPNGVFGPAWTLLYAMMAYALWRILALPEGQAGRGRAIGWFSVQLALNALWSWSFFALHSPAIGAVNIVLLLAALAFTTDRFWRLDRVAAWLLVPYLAWVVFAAYLNFGVWRLNS